MPSGRESRRLSFNKEEYLEFLRNDSGAKATAAKCNLWVMVNLVRDSLPEFGNQAYETIRNIDAKKQAVIERGIAFFDARSELARTTGQTTATSQLEAEASHGRKTLRQMRRDSLPKILGALHGRALEGALLYQVFLEEYLAAQNGACPHSKVTTYILSALLLGLDRFPKETIAPELFAKKSRQFRRRNPGMIKEMRRLIAPSTPSGESQLDLQYGKRFIADRI
jgi:hypothetical protein